MSDVLWKPVPGFGGIYSVSELGMVRSQKEIGALYEVNRRIINPIATGKTWKHVEI